MKPIKITPKSKLELSTAYKCCTKKIKRDCEAIGIKTKKRLTVLEVKRFYEHYGAPEIEWDGKSPKDICKN